MPLTPDLVTENYRLALWIARRYVADNGTPFDDIAQEACVGLLVASKKFDSAKGSFAPYATLWIKQRIRLYLRPTPQLSSLDEEVMEGVTPMDLVEDPRPSPDEQAALSELKAQVRDALSALSPREREVIESHYGLNGPPETLQEIGDRFGCSRERIRQIETAAFERLRGELADEMG